MNQTEQTIVDALPASGSTDYTSWYENLPRQTREALTANIQPMKRQKLIRTRFQDGVLVIERGENA